MSSPAVTPNPYAEFQQPAKGASPYADFQQPATVPTPTQNPQPHGAPGNIFTSGHPLETIRANYDDAVRPSNASDPHPVLHDLGRGFTETIAGPLVHPLDTVKGLAHGIAHMQSPTDPENPVAQMIGSTVQDFQDNGAAKAIPHLLGQAGGSFLGGEMGGEALGLASKVAKPIGAAIERGGFGVINHALDVTPKMMKYGQNPARGLVDEGIAPSLSKFSMGNKVDAALPEAGQRVSDAVHNSPFTAPKADIARSVEDPIFKSADISTGFGGGKSVDPLANLWASAERTAPGASGPIYGGGAPATVPAPDLWKSIQNLDKATRFNPDPEVEGVNEVRRDMRGGLRGNLEDAVPGLRPISQRYGDLATADDALSRSAGKGTPLKGLKDVFMFPTETAAGTAMVRGGRMMQVPPNIPAPVLGSPLFMGAKTPRKDEQ